MSATKYTLAQRAAILHMMAKAVPQSRSYAPFLADTANALDAVAAVYNELYNACVDAIQRSNGEDPAIIIISDIIRKQRGELRPK